MLIKHINPTKDGGFTIVELLIVIVVIGILATITSVAYGSLSDRAKEAKAKSTASMLYKKVQAKKAIDGKASPTNNPTSPQAIRQHYEIESMANDIVVQSIAINGSCIESESDTCNSGNPVFDRKDIVIMKTYETGSSGTPSNGCTSYGGVIIETNSNSIEIPDDVEQGVGVSCFAGA